MGVLKVHYVIFTVCGWNGYCIPNLNYWSVVFPPPPLQTRRSC